MGRRKEILIISIIIFITVILALMPQIISCSKSNNIEVNTNVESSYSKTINITLKGEINVPLVSDLSNGEYTNEVTLEFRNGVSYREIIEVVYNSYRTKYTIFDTNLSKTYTNDTTIVFESSYVSLDYEDDNTSKEEDTSSLICINTASKELLKTIYGIGEARATLIISYREVNTIDSFDELKSLLGVSDEVIETIKKQAIL